MPGRPRPRRLCTVIDVEARPLLLLLATLVSLLTAGVLAHALRTTRSRDSLMGWGWVLAGAVAVGTGLWSTQALALLGSRLAGTAAVHLPFDRPRLVGQCRRRRAWACGLRARWYRAAGASG